LPIIKGRQNESGWEYSVEGSDANDKAQLKGREGATVAIIDYLATAGESPAKEIVAELVERGIAEATAYRALKVMAGSGQIVKYTKTFPSGKSCPFYDINPNDIPTD
jgi:hypothetical protein